MSATWLEDPASSSRTITKEMRKPAEGHRYKDMLATRVSRTPALCAGNGEGSQPP